MKGIQNGMDCGLINDDGQDCKTILARVWKVEGYHGGMFELYHGGVSEADNIGCIT